MQVARNLAVYNVAILTNCAQELNFFHYVSTIKWKAVLSPWINCSIKDLQFHSRMLCCFVASSFGPGDLQILDMDSTDLESMLNMLGSASTSTQLKASGFGFTFSVTEILESLLHLLISQKNLSFLLEIDLIPSILAVFLDVHVQNKLLACQLLWILMGESHFQWDMELYCCPIKELLIAMIEDDNENLRVFSKLLLSEPCFGSNGKEHQLV